MRACALGCMFEGLPCGEHGIIAYAGGTKGVTVNFFLRWLCPFVAVWIFIGGLWIWIGGTYLTHDDEVKSKIVVHGDPENLFLNIFGLYFFLKCTFCSFVLFILSRWLSLTFEKRDSERSGDPS